MKSPAPKCLWRIGLNLALWTILSLLFALFAPFTTEAGEDLLSHRVNAFKNGPLIASFGWESFFSGLSNSSDTIVCGILIIFALLLSFTSACKSRSFFFALLSVQTICISAGFLRAAQLIQHWNEHGHG